MKNKLLSVVILTYNSSKTIENCLNSLKDQTNNNFEILIVDDNSTDNTLEKVKSFFDKTNISFMILTNGAHSIPRGRNIGIKECRTRYITFLDSDAYANKDWVKNIIHNFETDPNLAVVGGDTLPIHTSELSYAHALTYETIKELTRTGMWKIGGGNCALDLMKLKSEYFNENYKHCEDVEYFSRIRNKYKIKHDSSIKILHEHRDSIKKYYIQQYRYSIWELFFNFAKKKEIRILSFVPFFLIVSSATVSFFNPLFILTIPLLSFLFSLFVLRYKKTSIKYLPLLFISFLFKIIGFGFGTIEGLAEIILKSKRYIRLLK